jgi:hypothetical protein
VKILYEQPKINNLKENPQRYKEHVVIFKPKNEEHKLCQTTRKKDEVVHGRGFGG